MITIYYLTAKLVLAWRVEWTETSESTLPVKSFESSRTALTALLIARNIMQRRSKREREPAFYAEWAIGTRSEQDAQHERAKWERTIDESRQDADHSDSTSDDDDAEASNESVTRSARHSKRATAKTVMMAAAAAAAASSTPQTREQREQSHLAFIEANQNANTRATYASGWRQFVEWAQRIENKQRIAEDSVDLEHPTESDIAAYARFLVTVKGSTMSTVHGAIAAIAHKLQYVISEEYHPIHGVILKNTLQVLKLMAEPATQKQEVQWEQLVHIATEADRGSTKTSRRDACMFMLAYFTLLRSSEVVRMTRGEITFFPDKADGRMIMQVHVNKQCKNDVERLGHNRLVKEKEEGKECIVRRMQQYLAATAPQSTAAGMNINSVLFPKEDGGKMSRATPNHRFQHWLRVIGVEDATAYGFHSLRAGGATDAVRAGVSEREIKIHGNWRSNAVQLYMRPGQEEKLAASSALGR